jgi:hypothetical protein
MTRRAPECQSEPEFDSAPSRRFFRSFAMADNKKPPIVQQVFATMENALRVVEEAFGMKTPMMPAAQKPAATKTPAKKAAVKEAPAKKHRLKKHRLKKHRLKKHRRRRRL